MSDPIEINVARSERSILHRTESFLSDCNTDVAVDDVMSSRTPPDSSFHSISDVCTSPEGSAHASPKKMRRNVSFNHLLTDDATTARVPERLPSRSASPIVTRAMSPMELDDSFQRAKVASNNLCSLDDMCRASILRDECCHGATSFGDAHPYVKVQGETQYRPRALEYPALPIEALTQEVVRSLSLMAMDRGWCC